MRSLFVGLTLFLSVFSNVALAQDDDAAFTETYIKRTDGLARQNVDGRLKPLGFGLMGDSIDPSSGALTFSTTDVELKGNSKLEVAFRRRAKQPNRPNYQAGTIAQRKQQMLADWIVDVPFVSGTSIDDPSFDMANICERLVSDLREGEASIGFNGYDLNIPGRGMQKILGGGGAPNSPNPFSPSDWGAGGFPDMAGVTADHSKIGCITDVGAANGGGQGLLVITPDGTTYRMDRLFTVSVGTEPRACGNAGSLLIKEGRLVATEVTDVHGNWVKYTYTSDGRLTKILGNDGRQIDIAYISGTGNIQTVTANGRVWTYSYEDVAASSTRVLRSVALPDGRSWQYNIDALTGSSGSSLSVVHPYGTSATYAVASPTHYTRRWTNYDGCGGFGTFTRADRNLAVTSKSLSGPNIPTSTWQYSYSNLGTIEFDSSNTETANVKNSVTEPDGSLTDTWYYIAGSRMGKPLSSRTYSSAGGSLLEELSYTYNVGTPLAPVSGLEFSQFSDSLKQPVLVSKKVVTRGSDTFTTDISYNSDGAQSNYSYGNPVQISSYSNQSSQVRTKVIAYEHDKTNWILGMPTRITRNGKVFDELTYDEFGNVQTHDQFGVRQVSYTYDAAGMVASSTDALNRTTYYDNWKRGEAQEITRPDGVTLLETVDDNGWVTSQVDGKGNQTGYQYSNVGWLTKIDRPAPWEDTSFTYDDVGGANFRQTAVRGTAETVIWYDVLHRPWNKRVRPLSGGGLTSYTRVAYDAGGREAFRSFPSTSADPADGTTFTYDGLGRRRASAENIAPFATTNYAYLAGNKTQVTDPEGNVTTSTVQAYGSPEKGDVVQIAQPLGRNTDMAYDNYGNMLTATQYGSQNGFSVTSTQRYFYDTRLRLCRHSVPESGDTLMDYDDANQMVGVAKGQSPGTGCAALPVGAKIASTYDSLGRLTLVDFPGGTPDINYTYDNNSKVTRNQRGIADWRYTYDNADNLTEEKLLIDGRSYATSYEYDGLGAVAYQTFPTGRRVDFAPNGLGRATKVQHVGGVTYAAGMTYHPNGDVDNITFGNGFIRDTALNNRQELAAIHVGNGANTVMDLSYGHDANNRITSITDGVAASENRAFTYDGLGRVLTASGPWGAGSFKYDALDNIRQKVLGSRTVNIEYNAANRVVRAQDSSDGNAWKNYSYDADGNVENSGVYVFSYDFSDQPVTITGSTTNGAFSYDGNLKRAKQVLDGKTIYSVYSQTGALIHRDDATTATTTDYVTAEGRVVARVEGNVVTYTHDDHLGSPVAATDAAGAVAWRESFEPFGGKLIDPFGNKDDQGFAGHVSDAATGLVYMQARYYDPVIGRFLSVDPVNFSYGKPQSFNRYAYVANDPVNGRDSTGLEEDEAEITVTANCPPYCRSREGIPILVSPIPDPMPPPTWPEWHWRFSPFTPLRNICSNIGIFCSKPPADAKDPTGAKAPGKPGMDEGFNDPDTGEEWGKVEKGPMAGKSGWVDADDKIWVPTGQGSAAHGRGGGLAGAHWDVQDRQGRGHVNVYPGGHRR